MEFAQPGSSNPSLLKGILARRFRANPIFRLFRHTELAPEHQQTFAGLAEDPDQFGVLVPASHAGLGVLAVDQDTARLFSGLKRPGPLPEALRRGGLHRYNRRIAQLVLDGVLEIEREGQFVSGPLAHGEVVDRTRSGARPGDRIAQLSHGALRQAQALPIHDARRLSSWLYSFHSVPAGPRWVRRLGSTDVAARALGLLGSSRVATILDDEFLHSQVRGWDSWHLRDGKLAYTSLEGTAPAYKLYVSPHPRALADVFPAVVTCLIELRPPAFKIGSDVFGLLRPDKLMIYFNKKDELDSFVRALEPAILGCPAQGVPFTASLGEAGLLSWGVDPPRATRLQGWPGSESWRAWLVARLARALITARTTDFHASESWTYALDRMRVEGVDPDRWTPTPALWDEGLEP